MTKNKCEDKKKLTGSNPPEAWAEAEKVDKKTKVNKPSEEAVEEAKDWVDENQK
jgi:hypothetical protein